MGQAHISHPPKKRAKSGKNSNFVCRRPELAAVFVVESRDFGCETKTCGQEGKGFIFVVRGDDVMLKKVIVALGVGTAAVSSAFVASPDVRSHITVWGQSILDVPPNANDPGAVMDDKIVRLGENVERLGQTRENLSQEVEKLAIRVQERTEKLAQARLMADEYGNTYVEAKREDAFPVRVLGVSYTELNLKGQISMLLAQIDGYEKTLAVMKDRLASARTDVESLTVQIDSTQAALDSLAVAKQQAIANALAKADAELLAEVDAIVASNEQVVEDVTPIQPFDVLWERQIVIQQQSSDQTPESVVDQFLTRLIRAQETVDELSNEAEEVEEAAEANEVEEIASESRQPKPPRARKRNASVKSADIFTRI